MIQKLIFLKLKKKKVDNFIEDINERWRSQLGKTIAREEKAWRTRGSGNLSARGSVNSVFIHWTLSILVSCFSFTALATAVAVCHSFSFFNSSLYNFFFPSNSFVFYSHHFIHIIRNAFSSFHRHYYVMLEAIFASDLDSRKVVAYM